MDKNLNIPKFDPPSGKDELDATVGYAASFKNLVIGKAIQGLPGKLPGIVETILRPPSAIDIITDYLRKTPDPQQPVSRPALKIDTISTENLMDTVAGGTIGGKPLYANLEIDEFSWTDFNGQTKGFRKIVFGTVIMKVEQSKNIVETSIQGSEDGAVFEYSGLNNYDVEITLTELGNNINGVYPKDQVQEIIKMLTCPYPIAVHSWYLQMFNIYEIEIMKFSAPQIEGGISQQPITINCKSNNYTSLIIQ